MGINSYIAKQFAHPKGLGGSLVGLVMNRQNRPLYDETIRLLPLSDSDSVLDIGCGNGYVLCLLARRCNATFAGIDPSKEIVEAAKRRNRSHVKNGRMRFACQDASAMTFSDEAFSRVYTINTVYFWNGPLPWEARSMMTGSRRETTASVLAPSFSRTRSTAGCADTLPIPFSAAIISDNSSAIKTLLSSLKPSAIESPPPLP